MVLHFVDEPPRSAAENKKTHAQVSSQHSARHIPPTGRTTSRQCLYNRGQHAHKSSRRPPWKLLQVACWKRNATFWPHITSSLPRNCFEMLPQFTCEAVHAMAFWQGLKAQARFGGGFARLIRLRPPQKLAKTLRFLVFFGPHKICTFLKPFLLAKSTFACSL